MRLETKGGLVATTLALPLLLMLLIPAGIRTSAHAAGTSAFDPKMVERGEYLVHAMGCNDCHTPLKMGPNGPEPDMSRMLSGSPEGLVLGAPPKLEGGWGWCGDMTTTAFAGPWGISYAHNLTPDVETGIGAWPIDVFIQAVRSGKHMGKGEPILPPMPIEALRGLTDDDLGAVYAYLQSIPPIHNMAPTHKMAPTGR